MLRNILIISAVAATFSTTAFAGYETIKPAKGDNLAQCVKAALKVHGGKIVKMEMESENKKPVYEFDIESTDGNSWEVKCDARSGKITEVEQEVKNDHTKFKGAKVTEADAKATALKAHPGKIVETEYEVESDGKLTYEFDILEADNEEIKVEVDANTGLIIEKSYEEYQIGK